MTLPLYHLPLKQIPCNYKYKATMQRINTQHLTTDDEKIRIDHYSTPNRNWRHSNRSNYNEALAELENMYFKEKLVPLEHDWMVDSACK